jgi:hypothetical protein
MTAQLRSVFCQQGLTRLVKLLHRRREPHGVALRRVVHPEIVADLSDHDLSRVEAHTNGETKPPLDAHLIRPTSSSSKTCSGSPNPLIRVSPRSRSRK